MLKIIVEDAQNLNYFIECPSEFLATIFHALNSSQDSIRLECIDYLLKYIKHLFDFFGVLPFLSHQQQTQAQTYAISGISDDVSYQSHEKNPSVLDRVHINLSSIAEENPSVDFLRKNSEDFATFFEDSIISSPGIENLKRSAVQKPPQITEKSVKTGVFTEDAWLSILWNLKEKVKDLSARIRESAEEALFSLVLNFGYTFRNEFWPVIHKEVIGSFFEEMLRSFLQTSDSPENHAFRCLLSRTFGNYSKVISLYLPENQESLRDFLEIIKEFSENKHEFLAKLALSSFRAVLAKSFKKLSRISWDLVVKFIRETLEISTPKNLMEKENLEMFFPRNSSNLSKTVETYEAVFKPVNLRFDIKEILTKCVVQLLIIGITRELIERNVGFLSLEVKSLYFLKNSVFFRRIWPRCIKAWRNRSNSPRISISRSICAIACGKTAFCRR